MCHWRFFVTLTDWVTTGDPQSLSGDLFSGFWERYMTHQVICGDMKGFGSFCWKFESIHSSQFHLTACSMLLSERIFVALDPTTSHDPTTRRASWAGEASGFQFGTPSTEIGGSNMIKSPAIKNTFYNSFGPWQQLDFQKWRFSRVIFRSISTITRGRDGDMLAAACSTGSARECDVLPENLAINVVWNTNLGKCGMILYDFMYYS